MTTPIERQQRAACYALYERYPGLEKSGLTRYEFYLNVRHAIAAGLLSRRRPISDSVAKQLVEQYLLSQQKKGKTKVNTLAVMVDLHLPAKQAGRVLEDLLGKSKPARA